MTYTFESPRDLALRLKIGREEFCQRLLTSLILDGPYPRWNSRSVPSPRGMQFLDRLYTRCFAESIDDVKPEFVDELELPPRQDAEKGAAPDYGVFWPDHVWLIELKTERGSHRQDQVPSYFDLTAHHYPGMSIDLTYLTGPMSYDFVPVRVGDRYCQITWSDIEDDIRAVWGGSGNPSRQKVVDELCRMIADLESPATGWRDRLGYQEFVETPLRAVVRDGLELADAAAADGGQRAIDHDFENLDELLEARAELRAELVRAPLGSPRRRVMPWIWRWQSTGKPLTPGGDETGYEIRLSRYNKDLY